MQNQLKKVLGLAKKTGDRIIVFDQEGADNSYVVMPFGEYEKLAIGRSEVRGLTEDELLDKINRDIAIWKSEQEFIGNKQKIINSMDFEDTEDDFDEDDCFDYSEDAEDFEKFPYITDFEGEKEGEKAKKERNRGNNWVIPKDRKEAAEEIIEEDRQYLERVDF